MSIDYTIAAIPTVYRGRRYRSRLEARWAAFFDLLGWNHEYEPCDLGKWSPDFALWGCRPSFPILVEVKPITEWHQETARKMADACRDVGQRVLLLGVQPEFSTGFDQLGWLGETEVYEASWSEALISKGVPTPEYDFFPNSNGFGPDTWIWEVNLGLEMCAADALPLWTQAANEVQWHPKGSNR